MKHENRALLHPVAHLGIIIIPREPTGEPLEAFEIRKVFTAAFRNFSANSKMIRVMLSGSVRILTLEVLEGLFPFQKPWGRAPHACRMARPPRFPSYVLTSWPAFRALFLQIKSN